MTKYGTLYGTTSTTTSGSPILLILFALISIAVLVAWIWSISLFVNESRRKGHYNTAPLWFIGIFATPIVIGLYTAQLPDISKTQESKMSNATAQNDSNDRTPSSNDNEVESDE